MPIRPFRESRLAYLKRRFLPYLQAELRKQGYSFNFERKNLNQYNPNEGLFTDLATEYKWDENSRSIGSRVPKAYTVMQLAFLAQVPGSIDLKEADRHADVLQALVARIVRRYVECSEFSGGLTDFRCLKDVLTKKSSKQPEYLIDVTCVFTWCYQEDFYTNLVTMTSELAANIGVGSKITRKYLVAANAGIASSIQIS